MSTISAPAPGQDGPEHRSTRRIAVLLITANPGARFGERHTVQALIDQGSEISVITEAFPQRLRLPRTRTSVAVIGVEGHQIEIVRDNIKLDLLPRTADSS